MHNIANIWTDKDIFFHITEQPDIFSSIFTLVKPLNRSDNAIYTTLMPQFGAISRVPLS